MSIIKVNAMSEADALSIRRSGASMSRQSFCLALYRAQILNEPDAIAAAKGDWPAALGDLLNDLPAAEAAKARIIWASSVEIHRTHWLLLKVAEPENLDIPDDALDEIFGIE